MATKTGQNTSQLHCKFIEEIIDAPCLAKAPPEFWQHYSKAIKDVCKNKNYQVHLLSLFPSNEKSSEFCFSLVKSTEALTLFKDKTLCQNYSISPGKWLQQAIKYCKQEIPQTLFQIIRQHKKEFTKETLPYNIFKDKHNRFSLNIDFLDFLLELHIEIEPIPGEVWLLLADHWLEPKDNQEYQRELSFVSQNKNYALSLKHWLDYFYRTNSSEEKILKLEKLIISRPHFKEFHKQYLFEICAQSQKGYIYKYIEVMAKLRRFITSYTAKMHPELVQEIENIDLVKIITENLQQGIFAELCFPPLDVYYAKQKKENRSTHGVFPYLTVVKGEKVTVMGPQSFVKDYEITIPKRHEYHSSYYVNGDLLVFLDQDYSYKAYWASDPTKIFTEKDLWSILYCEASLTPILFAKNKFAVPAVFYDGKTYWAQGNENKFFEWNPNTDNYGKESLPEFFTSFIKKGEELITEHCSLNSLPGGVKSPLGSKDGFVAWRLKKSDQNVCLEGIDGRKWEGITTNGMPTMLIDWPAKEEKILIWKSANSSEIFAKRTDNLQTIFELPYDFQDEYIFPLSWWHLLEPRDLKCSQKLRTIAPETIAKTLVSAQKEYAKGERANLTKLISTEIPEITNTFIAAGVAFLFDRGIGFRNAVKQKLGVQKPIKIQKPKKTSLHGETLSGAMQGLIKLQDLGPYLYGGNLLPKIQKLDQWLKLKNKEEESSFDNSCSLLWLALPGSLGTLAFLALSHMQTERGKKCILCFMENMAHSSLLEYKDQIKIYTAKYHGEDLYHCSGKTFVEIQEESIYFIRYYKNFYDHIETIVMELSKNNEIIPPPKHSVVEQIPVQNSWLDKEKLMTFIEHSPTIEITQAHINTFCQHTGISTGAAVWLLGGMDKYDKWDEYQEFCCKLKLKKTLVDHSICNELPDFSQEQINAIFGPAMNAYWNFIEEPQQATSQFVETLANSWNKVVGKRNPISPQLLETARSTLNYNYYDFLLHLTGANYPGYTTDGQWQVDGEQKKFKVQPQKCFTHLDFDNFINLALWLYDQRPACEPIAKNLHVLVEEINKRLLNPKLILVCHEGYLKCYPKAKELDMALSYLENVLGKYQKPLPHVCLWNTDGIVVTFAQQDSHTYLCVGFTPVYLKDSLLIDKVLQLQENKEEIQPSLERWKLFHSKDFQNILKRIDKTPLKKGQWEHNPLNSVPKLLSQVQKEYELSSQAAILYLQTLALALPTKKNIKKWNGWRDSVYKAATEELVEKKLLIEAKRRGAGRKHFLPGGWINSDFPIESWKLPLYSLAIDDANNLIKPLRNVFPLKPIHEIFKEAWHKIKSKDS